MRKLISLTLLLLSSFVLGSDVRIGALGGNAGFWPDDDQNISLFPSTINNFNLAQVGGIGGDSTTIEYANFVWGDQNKYGFFLNSADNLLNIAYGGGSWGLLLGVNSNSSEVGDVKTSNLHLDTRFGLEMGFGEVGVNFAMTSNDDGDDDSDDPSSMDIGFNLRRDQNLWEFSHMLFQFNMMTTALGDASTSDMTVDLHLFQHWEVGDATDLLFALGFGYHSASPADKVTETNITLPSYTLAVETNMLELATARVGVTNGHYLSQSTDNDGTVVKSSGLGTFDLNFGLGIDYGGFALDVDLRPGFFLNPVSYVTGFNDETLATQATMTFSW